MSKKIKVGILFGGRSTEHEVSIRSAKSIYEALDKNKYEPVLICVDKSGKWLPQTESKKMLHGELASVSVKDIVVPDFSNDDKKSLDVIFPVMHGSFGEDGTMQGMLKIFGIPFVGPSVLGSAIGMDKDVTKRLLRDAGIHVAPFFVFYKHEIRKINFNKIKKEFGVPFFVKPANAGSSVGVSKVKNKTDFDSAITSAFLFDRKILIEKTIVGREIECAVLGNEFPVASVPGEVVPGDEFYSYDDKYAEDSNSKIQIPVLLPKAIIKKIQSISLAVYKILELEGMARVDFFYSKNGKILVNEVNTIPGFTSISMYPKMWEASGVSFTELISKLIEFAIDRYKHESQLISSI